MMRIGVLSDSHLSGPDPRLAARLAQVFTGAEMILHAGDLVSLPVLDMLEAPEVLAVAGNMDHPPVAQSLPGKREIRVEGITIGLIHGWGSPLGIVDRIAQEFSGVDVIVFGHSHRVTNLVKHGTLFFNPGSAGKGLFGGGTVGILEVEGKEASASIIKL